MNKYQKRKSREIKQIANILPRTTYKQAKREWHDMREWRYFHPCENCCTIGCRKIGKPIVFCLERT